MREFTPIATDSDVALLSLLADEGTQPSTYASALQRLGESLGEALLTTLGESLPQYFCIACTVEDADSLAQGIIDRLAGNGLADRIRVVCFWNDRIDLPQTSLAPILKEYREPCELADSVLVVVKSIISSACVVRTNLANLVANADPKRIFVVAPVMFKGAENSLEGEFSPELSKRFEYLAFAIDDEKRDGKWVIPGVGGEIYKRLGFGGLKEKNRHVPRLVKYRRARTLRHAAA